MGDGDPRRTSDKVPRALVADVQATQPYAWDLRVGGAGHREHLMTRAACSPSHLSNGCSVAAPGIVSLHLGDTDGLVRCLIRRCSRPTYFRLAFLRLEGFDFFCALLARVEPDAARFGCDLAAFT